VFTINEPPSQKLNKAFIDDLLAQSRMLQGSQGTVALDNVGILWCKEHNHMLTVIIDQGRCVFQGDSQYRS
jgi:hypothetical protein